jgi:hypothetical protein
VSLAFMLITCSLIKLMKLLLKGLRVCVVIKVKKEDLVLKHGFLDKLVDFIPLLDLFDGVSKTLSENLSEVELTHVILISIRKVKGGGKIRLHILEVHGVFGGPQNDWNTVHLSSLLNDLHQLLFTLNSVEPCPVIISYPLFLRYLSLVLVFNDFLLSLFIIERVDEDLILKVKVSLESASILTSVLAVEELALAVHLRLPPKALVMMTDGPLILSLPVHVVALERPSVD